MTLVSEWRAFAGVVRKFTHLSSSTKTEMTFSVFLPPVALGESPTAVPALWYLSGLTCTSENVMQKAGAQRVASELGIALICPDTSPRGAGIEGEDDSWDFGTGAW